MTAYKGKPKDRRRYYAAIPHLADDELDVFEYRLYGHYTRVCGENRRCCTEGVRQTAQATGMSHPMVIRARASLEAKGYITTKRARGKTIQVMVTDIWQKNSERYDQRDRNSGGGDAGDSRINRAAGDQPDNGSNQQGQGSDQELEASQNRDRSGDQYLESTGHPVESSGHTVESPIQHIDQSGHHVESKKNYKKNIREKNGGEQQGAAATAAGSGSFSRVTSAGRSSYSGPSSVNPRSSAATRSSTITTRPSSPSSWKHQPNQRYPQRETLAQQVERFQRPSHWAEIEW